MRWENKQPEMKPNNNGWYLHFAWFPVNLTDTNAMVWWEYVEVKYETKHYWSGSDTYAYYRDVQPDSPWANDVLT